MNAHELNQLTELLKWIIQAVDEDYDPGDIHIGVRDWLLRAEASRTLH